MSYNKDTFASSEQYYKFVSVSITWSSFGLFRSGVSNTFQFRGQFRQI